MLRASQDPVIVYVYVGKCPCCETEIKTDADHVFRQTPLDTESRPGLYTPCPLCDYEVPVRATP
jgi:hypothetical protein